MAPYFGPPAFFSRGGDPCVLLPDHRWPRVPKAEETGELFCRPNDFRVDDYVGSGPEERRIAQRFTPVAAGRAAEKTWHKSQTTQEPEDGSLLLRMELSDLREIKRWVLWWGAEVEVVEPEELREIVRGEVERVERMGRTYNSSVVEGTS